MKQKCSDVCKSIKIKVRNIYSESKITQEAQDGLTVKTRTAGDDHQEQSSKQQSLLLCSCMVSLEESFCLLCVKT